MVEGAVVVVVEGAVVVDKDVAMQMCLYLPMLFLLRHMMMTTYVAPEEFQPLQIPGPHLPDVSQEEPLEIELCSLFVDQDVLQRLVTATNDYAEKNQKPTCIEDSEGILCHVRKSCAILGVFCY